MTSKANDKSKKQKKKKQNATKLQEKEKKLEVEEAARKEKEAKKLLNKEIKDEKDRLLSLTKLVVSKHSVNLTDVKELCNNIIEKLKESEKAEIMKRTGKVEGKGSKDIGTVLKVQKPDIVEDETRIKKEEGKKAPEVASQREEERGRHQNGSKDIGTGSYVEEILDVQAHEVASVQIRLRNLTTQVLFRHLQDNVEMLCTSLDVDDLKSIWNEIDNVITTRVKVVVDP